MPTYKRLAVSADSLNQLELARRTLLHQLRLARHSFAVRRWKGEFLPGWRLYFMISRMRAREREIGDEVHRRNNFEDGLGDGGQRMRPEIRAARTGPVTP